MSEPKYVEGWSGALLKLEEDQQVHDLRSRILKKQLGHMLLWATSELWNEDEKMARLEQVLKLAEDIRKVLLTDDVTANANQAVILSHYDDGPVAEFEARRQFTDFRCTTDLKFCRKLMDMEIEESEKCGW